MTLAKWLPCLIADINGVTWYTHDTSKMAAMPHCWHQWCDLIHPWHQQDGRHASLLTSMVWPDTLLTPARWPPCFIADINGVTWYTLDTSKMAAVLHCWHQWCDLIHPWHQQDGRRASLLTSMVWPDTPLTPARWPPCVIADINGVTWYTHDTSKMAAVLHYWHQWCDLIHPWHQQDGCRASLLTSMVWPDTLLTPARWPPCFIADINGVSWFTLDTSKMAAVPHCWHQWCDLINPWHQQDGRRALLLTSMVWLDTPLTPARWPPCFIADINGVTWYTLDTSKMAAVLHCWHQWCDLIHPWHQQDGRRASLLTSMVWPDTPLTLARWPPCFIADINDVTWYTLDTSKMAAVLYCWHQWCDLIHPWHQQDGRHASLLTSMVWPDTPLTPARWPPCFIADIDGVTWYTLDTSKMAAVLYCWHQWCDLLHPWHQQDGRRASLLTSMVWPDTPLTLARWPPCFIADINGVTWYTLDTSKMAAVLHCWHQWCDLIHPWH